MRSADVYTMDSQIVYFRVWLAYRASGGVCDGADWYVVDGTTTMFPRKI